MMEQVEHCRSEGVTVEDVSADGRTIEGWALRWDTPYRVTDDGREFYEEQWRYRATARTIAHRRNTFELQHDHRGERVGLAEFAERADGLWFHAEIEPDQEQLIADVRAGRKGGVSVRYNPVVTEKLRSDPEGVLIEIVEAKLRELSITARPQYRDDARIEVLRAEAERTQELVNAARAEMARYQSLRCD